MEKMTRILGYLPEMAFVGLTIRAMVMGTGIGDAVAILSLVLSIGYAKYLNKSKVDEKAEIDKKIEDLSTQIQSLRMERAVKRTSNEQKVENVPGSSRRFF